MGEIRYWIWLSCRHGMSPKSKCRVLEHFGTPQRAYFADDAAYKAVEKLTEKERELLCDKNLVRTERILDICKKKNIDIITMEDSRYPVRLKNIYDPPVVLYAMGRLPWMDEECAITIAGTRKATPYGIKMGRRMGYEVTKLGGLVVSGLAYGIDSAGAEGALEAGGRCVGVLGTSIDEIYPKSNSKLFERVLQKGAIISEYPPETEYLKTNFPNRNRILAGLSVGTLIIEAPAKSGALITADRASEQGRDVYVVPGNADAPACEGSNRLLRDCGAKAVLSGRDIICEYEGLYPQLADVRSKKIAPLRESAAQAEAPVKKENKAVSLLKSFVGVRMANPGRKKAAAEPTPEDSTLRAQLADLSETQLKIVAAITEPDTHVDKIIERTGLPAQSVLAELTILQIDGVVIQKAGKTFTLNLTVQN